MILQSIVNEFLKKKGEKKISPSLRSYNKGNKGRIKGN